MALVWIVSSVFDYDLNTAELIRQRRCGLWGSCHRVLRQHHDVLVIQRSGAQIDALIRKRRELINLCAGWISVDTPSFDRGRSFWPRFQLELATGLSFRSVTATQ